MCFEESRELRLGLSCDLLPGFQLTFSDTSKREGGVPSSEAIMQ